MLVHAETTYRVRHVDISPLLKQQFHSVNTALPGCIVQWGKASLHNRSSSSAATRMTANPKQAVSLLHGQL